MLKRTGTSGVVSKQRRGDDRTTSLSRLIMIGNLRIDLFVWWTKNVWLVVEKPVNPKCGLRVWEIGTITLRGF